jgi:hypothetical protein
MARKYPDLSGSVINWPPVSGSWYVIPDYGSADPDPKEFFTNSQHRHKYDGHCYKMSSSHKGAIEEASFFLLFLEVIFSLYLEALLRVSYGPSLLSLSQIYLTYPDSGPDTLQ